MKIAPYLGLFVQHEQSTLTRVGCFGRTAPAVGDLIAQVQTMLSRGEVPVLVPLVDIDEAWFYSGIESAAFAVELSAAKEYAIEGPDGLFTQPDALTGFEDALLAMVAFVDRFRRQGHYSTSSRERLTLEQLANHLTLIELED